MRLLAHRGFWSAKKEQNTRDALLKALLRGYGIETDIRDYDRGIVISHDMPESVALSLKVFLDSVKPGDQVLALNVKADGLSRSLKTMLTPQLLSRVFFFDMSVPDMKEYLSIGLPVYTRHSDIERTPCYYDVSIGVWLDTLEAPWFGPREIEQHLNAGKAVAIVSEDLHKRPHHAQWERLLPLANRKGIYLCTDFVEEAETFFGLKSVTVNCEA